MFFGFNGLHHDFEFTPAAIKNGLISESISPFNTASASVILS